MSLVSRARQSRYPAAFLLALALPACAAVKPVAPPEVAPPMPPAWESTGQASAEAPASPDGEWWSRFEDPALERLITAALAGNQNLAAAGARLDAALAGARIAGADLSPQISTSLSGSRRRQNFIGLPIPASSGSVPSSTSTNLGISLNVSWELDVWGRLRATSSAGEARAAASSADLASARLSLAGQTAKGWFAVLEAEQQVALAAETLASRERTVGQVRRRFNRGLRNALDLRLALTNQAAAEASLATRERRLDAARRQLQVLLGRYPSSDPDLLEPAGLPALPPPPAAGLPAEIILRRPDLRAAERRLEGLGFDLRAARAALYPRLSLTGSGGRVSSQLEDLLESDFSVWSLASNLLQPVFQGGRLRAGVDLVEANQREAAHGFAEQLLRAFSEVERSLAATAFLDQIHTALAEAATQAAAAESLAEERYLAGLNDYLSVLETQRQAFLAKSQLLDVERQRLDNRVDLHLALGGAESVDEPGVK